MGLFFEIISILKLALEIYKTLRGVPDGKKEQVKLHVLEQATKVRELAIRGAETSDYSDLEDFINRNAG